MEASGHSLTESPDEIQNSNPQRRKKSDETQGTYALSCLVSPFFILRSLVDSIFGILRSSLLLTFMTRPFIALCHPPLFSRLCITYCLYPFLSQCLLFSSLSTYPLFFTYRPLYHRPFWRYRHLYLVVYPFVTVISFSCVLCCIIRCRIIHIFLHTKRFFFIPHVSSNSSTNQQFQSPRNLLSNTHISKLQQQLSSCPLTFYFPPLPNLIARELKCATTSI